MQDKILILQTAAFGYKQIKNFLAGDKFLGLKVMPAQSIFPALTCPVQATMRTASLPEKHGIVANGFFFKEIWKPLFWEQSSRLISGKRIWDNYRLKNKKVAQLFIQQSLGFDSDIIISPAPVHKHGGGMIMDCMCVPEDLSKPLKKKFGVFPLHRYWGPLASINSTKWIYKAVSYVMSNRAPDLLYAYLPHLDYSFQRSGPDSADAKKSLNELNSILSMLISAAENQNYRVLMFGDYSITPAHGVVFPNKFLRESGLFSTRNINGRYYPDFHTSKAFALADHQIAHIYIFDTSITEKIKNIFNSLNGVDKVLDSSGKHDFGIDNPRSGELVLIAKPGYWFDYRWWSDKKEAPDFASHVDIHNKPGYDPCELFWGWPPPSISQDPYRIKGTHGRVDKDEPVFFASNFQLPGNPKTLLDLSKSIKALLES